MIIVIFADRDIPAADAWTADDVKKRLIAAMKLDRLSPRLRGPRAPGSVHPTVEYSREEIEERQAWDIEEMQGKEPRRPLIQAERDFMDSVLGWFAYIGDESEQTRRVFAAWLKGKAAGYGAMKHWQAKHGVLNGSVKHARDRCVAAIVARLDADAVAKVEIPNPGRFDRITRKAA